MRPGDVVTTVVTGAAPHHLIADAELLDHRRTRAGDAHESGRRVKALRTNLTRWDQEDFEVDQPVWLAWHACSPAVLLS